MSNFLQVPSNRRDSYKSGVWDNVLLEAADQAGSSSSQVSCNDGDEEKSIKSEKEDAPDVNQEFYLRLVQEAPFIPGDAGELITFQEIPWIDYALVKESIVFHQKYYALEMFAMTAAIMFGFAIKPTAAVILKSRAEQIANPTEFLHRHISTLQRISKFFDFHKKPDEAYEQVLKIRKIHADTAQLKGREIGESQREALKLDEPWKAAMVLAIRKDLERIQVDNTAEEELASILTWNPSVPSSQFDMVTTQLGFWLYMWQFPRFFGIKNREKEMRGLIHVWAIFGRLLGVQDSYNVCLLKPEVATSAIQYDKLFKGVILESLKSVDETVITLQNTFVDGLRQRVPIITYKAVLYIGLRQNLGFKGENLWMLMNWKDKVCVRLLQAFFLLMRHSKYFRIAINYLIYFWFHIELLLNLPGKKWKLGLPRYLENYVTLKLY